MMGDIVISAETAARQAAERGHTLLDEIRILVVRLIDVELVPVTDLLFNRNVQVK